MRRVVSPRWRRTSYTSCWSSQKSSVAWTEREFMPGAKKSSAAPEPGSSFGSSTSGVGSGDASAASAAAPSSSPHPDSESRPGVHSPQPVAGFESTAVRSSRTATCDAVNVGRRAIRFAATAATSGAANDVPSGCASCEDAQSV